MLFDVESSRTGFVKIGANGEVYAFDGDGSGGGRWVHTGITAPIDSTGQAQNWIRFTFRQDYTAKKWDLYLNGVMVLYDLGFRDNSKNFFSLLALQGLSGGDGMPRRRRWVCCS